MPKPKKIIGITGTNGKTTVSNMIEDVLEDNGIEFMCNRSGTNVATGVASTLIANSHFFGKPKCDLAVFELDERSAPNIYPYMQPDIVLCTNIFRDSYKRNAHAEFILDILNKEIPKGTKLVLNPATTRFAAPLSPKTTAYISASTTLTRTKRNATIS